MNTQSLRKQASKLVLAVALATGTAMVAGHIVPDPAHAQRAKKDRKKKKNEDQPEYSKEFIAAYQPLNEQVNAEGADVAPLVDQVKALIR